MNKEALREAFEAGEYSLFCQSDRNMGTEKSFTFEDWYHQVYELGVEFVNPIYRDDEEEYQAYLRRLYNK